MKRTPVQNFLSFALVKATKLPLVGNTIYRMIQNRFDSAFQGWGERSWIFQSLQDAWLEIDSMTRQELQRIHDSLVENSPLVAKIRALKIQFAVGPAGLKVIPESSDEGFNDARALSWEAWCKRPELGCDLSFPMLTRVWEGLLFDKGAIFVNLTQENILGLNVPRLQTIDCHRVKNPSGLIEDEETGYPIVDGVVIQPVTGARVAYYVRDTNYKNAVVAGTMTTQENYKRIRAFDPAQPQKGGIIHKFKVRRPGQIREVPEGTSVYNLVRDNMDLHKLEMQAAKLASSIGPIETNPTGELDALNNRKQRLQIQTQNSQGNPISKNSWVDYNVFTGAQKIALKIGSKLSDFMINRPTVATSEYWDLHISLICLGYNISRLLVMPIAQQGTITRLDSDVCNGAFLEDFEILRELCEMIYQWQGQWDVSNNKLLKPARKPDAKNKVAFAKFERSSYCMDAKLPDDPHVCLIRPPRAPNMDIGYTAQALELELQMGVKSIQDVCAANGKDWRNLFRQKAEFLAYIAELATEFTLEKGEISSLEVSANPDPNAEPPPGDGGKKKPEAAYAV